MKKEDLQITTEYNSIKDMVADIRNKMSPLKLYFEMLKDVESSDGDIKNKLLEIINQEKDKCPVCIEYIENVLNKICKHV